MQPPVYIDTNKALARLASRLLGQKAIAVDTEANSLFAYREQLCLMQISAGGRDYLVDPLADLDLGLLSPVFADSTIVKIFHDAEFDILTLKRAHPFEFAALFDTKVVASALGLGQVGLAALLEKHLGVHLDKKYQRSDWGQRPLTQGQLDYARLDTHYLVEVVRSLRPQLHEGGEPLVQEVAAECRRLAALTPDPRSFDPNEFVKVRGADRLDGRGRRALRELFVMRERIAEERDRPVFKVLSADVLVALARERPQDEADLAAVKGLPSKLVQRHGGAILRALQRAAKLAPIDVLPRVRVSTDRLSTTQRAAYEDLRAWRKTIAASRDTDPSLVLPRTMMVSLARVRPVPKTVQGLVDEGVLEGWRASYYGEPILEILHEAAVRQRGRA